MTRTATATIQTATGSAVAPALSDAEMTLTFQNMASAPGWVAPLAQAWLQADPRNRARIAEAFPNLLWAYGPDSPGYGC